MRRFVRWCQGGTSVMGASVDLKWSYILRLADYYTHIWR